VSYHLNPETFSGHFPALAAEGVAHPHEKHDLAMSDEAIGPEQLLIGLAKEPFVAGCSTVGDSRAAIASE
jgi:hypothetical protein